MFCTKPLKLAIMAFTVSLIAFTISIYYLSVYNYQSFRKQFENQLIQIVNIASTLIDTDRHQLLTQESQTNSPLYSELVEPLVQIHNAIPEITYLYTMVFDDEKSYFILDSAMSPKLVTDKALTGSTVMEEYDEHPAYRTAVATIKRGETNVLRDIFTDEFGVFVSASAPLWDSEGNIIGLVGVDFDAQYFEQYQQSFYKHSAIAMIFALALSMVIASLTYRRVKSTEQKQNEQRKIAVTDQLTGAYNRHYIEEISQSALERYQQERESFAILLLDFDYFKEINDTYGHQAGDLVLQQSVEHIKTVLRTVDEIIRWGGEEFLIFLPETGEKQVIEIAERIRQEVELHPIKIEATKALNVTASIGVGVIKANEELSDLLHRVDAALYQAKAEGRNCVKVAEKGCASQFYA